MIKQGDHRPYHHGDLRRALLDAAFQLLAERGIPDFTLREVARQAGVSHNAPYHHFADKAELVVALTVEGFHRLEVALRSAYEQHGGTPFERTTGLCQAYVRFAFENQSVYTLMIRPELRQSSHYKEECDEAVKSASGAAFQVFLDGFAASQQAGELRTDQSVEMLVLALWSTLHGLTVLMLDYFPIEHFDHLLSEKKTASTLEKTEQLMAQVIEVMAQGLMRPS